MTEVTEKTYTEYILPPTVVSKIDLSRLVSEVERVENDLTSAAVRSEVAQTAQPKITVSSQLSEFLIKNGLNIADNKVRGALIKQLRLMKDKVPVVHMTFAVQADPNSIQQIVSWLRTSVHPQAMLSIGLQPSLVAGVYLRTPNQVHDLSLRSSIEGSRNLLVAELEGLRAR